jgi:hypothetical protein
MHFNRRQLRRDSAHPLVDVILALALRKGLADVRYRAKGLLSLDEIEGYMYGPSPARKVAAVMI